MVWHFWLLLDVLYLFFCKHVMLLEVFFTAPLFRSQTHVHVFSYTQKPYSCCTCKKHDIALLVLVMLLSLFLKQTLSEGSAENSQRSYDLFSHCVY